MRQSVEIELAGQKLVIKTDEGPEYVQELADYVDGQLRELGAGGRSTFNLQRMALLVAIALADELFREKDLHRQFRLRMSAKLEGLDAALVDHEARLANMALPANGNDNDDASPQPSAVD